LGTTATTTTIATTTAAVINTTSHANYLGDDDWTCDTAAVKPLVPICGDNGSGTIGGIPKELVGDILVIVAQIIVSIQMVYEEKVLSQYAIAPLQAVGSEGFFGFVLMTICLIAFAFIPTNSIDWGHSSIPLLFGGRYRRPLPDGSQRTPPLLIPPHRVLNRLLQLRRHLGNQRA